MYGFGVEYSTRWLIFTADIQMLSSVKDFTI